jgi:Zn-dependent peptidase ImmA (M78 family)/DNA-binding XRE family transcriptional regulator
MAIGERIRMARNLKSFSQEQLGKEVGVSKQAISDYEAGKYYPDSSQLLKISKALGKKMDYFFRSFQVSKIKPLYRENCKLTKKDKEEAETLATDFLERYCEVDNLANENLKSNPIPEGYPKTVSSFDEVEQAADRLRNVWEIGKDPIGSLTDVLESKGIKIILIKGPEKFDACTFEIEINGNSEHVIIANEVPITDRLRFSIAHELGHIMLKPVGIDDETCANQFAGAFLIPKEMLFYEMGEKRNHIKKDELERLKKKWGISMMAIVHRACDIGIIPGDSASFWYSYLRKKDNNENLPIDNSENPKRLTNLLERLFADEIISASRARELLGSEIPESWCAKDR